MLVDYHVHVMGHGERAQTVDAVEPFIIRALEQDIKEIGFADHDWYVHDFNFSVFEELQKKYPSINIRVGIEVDHMPGREKEIQAFLAEKPFDYVIGSVHHLGKWMFDHPDYVHEYQTQNIDDIYRDYFNLVKGAALTGMYHIIGHLDLIKVFGYLPTRPVLALTGDLFSVLKKSGVSVEINTNGLYKPIAEIYPAQELVQECYKYDIPITFSSDAHRAEDTGRDIRLAKELATRTGYRQIATYSAGEKILVKL